jgi:hypothetical protein
MYFYNILHNVIDMGLRVQMRYAGTEHQFSMQDSELVYQGSEVAEEFVEIKINAYLTTL